MGNIHATNTLNSVISNSVTILNQSTETCRTTLQQEIDININKCSTVNIIGINFNQSGSISTKCAESNSAKNNVKSEIDSEFKQAATAINQALSLNPGSTSSNNITNLMEQLSVNIQNEFTQNCINSVVNKDTISVTCSGKDGTANLEYLNFNQTANSISNCTLSSTSVNSVITQIKTIISQTAISKVAPLFSLGFIIIILAAIFLFMYQGEKSLTQIIIVLIIVGSILLIIYAIFASIYGWVPFKSKK